MRRQKLIFLTKPTSYRRPVEARTVGFWPGPALGGPPRYRFYVLRVTGPFMHLYNVLNNLTLAARDRRVRNNPQFARFHLW